MRYTFKFGYTFKKEKFNTELWYYGFFGQHIIFVFNTFLYLKLLVFYLAEHFVHFFSVKLVNLHVWINNM